MNSFIYNITKTYRATIFTSEYLVPYHYIRYYVNRFRTYLIRGIQWLKNQVVWMTIGGVIDNSN